MDRAYWFSLRDLPEVFEIKACSGADRWASGVSGGGYSGDVDNPDFEYRSSTLPSSGAWHAAGAKKGSEDQAIGARAVAEYQIHMAVRGRISRFTLTAGRRYTATTA